MQGVIVADAAQMWQLQDAKNRFSAVVEAALGGEPQHVTRRGQPVVVVVAVDEFERLCRLDSAAAPTFGRLLAAMPTDGGEFERLDVSPRDIEL
ncbi:type II toxin-antitoxin system prevent-host-death family antitoxin [Candidatus Poriferisodalis sp.]|uniref:type II toxin-antitoxin system prevent-host-death family antitoxin n=1 Tax=Candidatus Poriferisodalis sp. TaxID=3101277 RepID=UPI003B02162A